MVLKVKFTPEFRLSFLFTVMCRIITNNMAIVVHNQQFFSMTKNLFFQTLILMFLPMLQSLRLMVARAGRMIAAWLANTIWIIMVLEESTFHQLLPLMVNMRLAPDNIPNHKYKTNILLSLNTIFSKCFL